MTSRSRRLHHRLVAVLPVYCVLAASVAAGFELTPADEGEDAGQSLTVQGEVVTLTILESISGYDNHLAPAGSIPEAGVSCRDAPMGFTSLIGRFGARQELELTLTTPAGDVWTMGPGIGNDDLVPHARATVTGPDSVRVAWEDLRGGGDVDYNDCVVELRITPAR